jgi:hypothetical protein
MMDIGAPALGLGKSTGPIKPITGTPAESFPWKCVPQRRQCTLSPNAKIRCLGNFLPALVELGFRWVLGQVTEQSLSTNVVKCTLVATTRIVDGYRMPIGR